MPLSSQNFLHDTPCFLASSYSFSTLIFSFISSFSPSSSTAYSLLKFSSLPPLAPSLFLPPPLISLNFICLNPLCSELSSTYTLTSLSALPIFIAASISAISTANSSFAPPRLLIPASFIRTNGYFWELRLAASLRALKETPKISAATAVST